MMSRGKRIVKTWMAVLLLLVDTVALETKVSRQVERKGMKDVEHSDALHVPEVATWSEAAQVRH